MDKLLFERHLGQKVRRGGGRTKNQRKRTGENDERFERSLRHVIDEVSRPNAQTGGES